MSRFGLAIFSLFLLLIPALASADGARLYVSPALGTYMIGQTFAVQILVDTGGTSVNAAEATLQFDPSNLKVSDILLTGSIFGAWPTEPSFSNASGTISFTGWAKEPYRGPNGLLLTVRFTALKDATAGARFAAGAILATNGGSNIISSMQGGAYTIQPAYVAPTSSAVIETPLEAGSSTDAAATSSVGTRTTSEIYPTFTEYNHLINVGDPIILRGAASPDATLKVSIQEGESGVTSSLVSAGADGLFTFVSAPIASPGIYRVWVAEQFGSAEGTPSAPITITARETPFAAEASTVANLAIDLFPYLLLLALIALGSAYLYHRHRVEMQKYTNE